MVDLSTTNLLLLDVDECLVYAAERPLPRPADFRVGPYHVYRRPHLEEFLRRVQPWYRLALWSSGTADYVAEIARQICPADLEWAFIWSRDRCTWRLEPETAEYGYLKDLRKIKRQGYRLERVLFVENTPRVLARHYGNAIYVKTFLGDPADDELTLLARYLEAIRSTPNFRTLEKRGWRTQRLS